MSRLTICAVLLFSASTAFADTPEFDSLELKDSYGKPHRLAELGDKQLTVVAFLGTECPLAKLYGPRMRQLAERFADKDVAFIGVNSNIQDSLTEVTAYVNRSRIAFPMLLDTEHKLADLLKAERTPEVFVLDAKRNVRYQGRIDDQYAISVAREKPKTEDLADALTNLLSGKEPTTTRTEAIGCIIGRRKKTQPTGEITYSKHIAPIFNKRCLECHRSGELAPFALESFEDTVGWTDMIAEVIDEGRMPPWNANPKFGHFQNDARLTADEKKTVLTWIKNGAPEGNKNDLPNAPDFVEGWRIEKPDAIVKMRSKPFSVPATGVVDYKHFRVDPKLDEDVWINAVEARPGNPEVVHHIVVYVLIPGQKRNRDGLGTILIGYAPGTSPMVYPKDAGMLIPKGSQLIFEMHYTPNGEPATDLSYIGVKFIEKDKVKQEIVGSEAMNSRIRIPANAANHVMTAKKEIKETLRLITLTPHMHLRGKAFRYEAQYPDGRRETLLDVPKYDFNWQLRYEFAKPPLLPKGSVLHCTAVYDNSENNLNNPEPNKLVRWGDQSDEEMMIGFYTGVKPRVVEEQAAKGSE
jgi:peroxiredoxin